MKHDGRKKSMIAVAIGRFCRYSEFMADMETTLKRAVKESPLSYRGLARQAGISQASISLFMIGTRSLTLGNASKLAKALGLELKPAKRSRGK